jgi:repressor LexA
MKALSERQLALLAFAHQFLSEHGYPPSVRELGEGVGLHSSCTVHRHLNTLEQRGYLKRTGRKSRTLELTPKALQLLGRSSQPAASPSLVQVPLVGTIAAGAPLLAEEHIEDYLAFDEKLLGSGTFFALKIQGDSMIEAGLFEDDLVVVRRQPTAENGEIVAALLEDGATVKRFYKHEDCLELRPANPNWQSLFTREARILGKVVLVQRSLE